jgi:hypothetical protein
MEAEIWVFISRIPARKCEEKMRLTVLAASCMLILGGLSSVAQASLITNGGFDTDVSGWTCLPWVNGSWGGTRWAADQGGCAAIWGDGAEGGYLYQDNTTHPFGAGEQYNVAFALAWLGTGKPSVTVSLFDITPATPEPVASMTIPGSQLTDTFVPYSFDYTVDPSRVGHNWRVDVNPLQWGGWVGVDQVAVTAVPEPTALGLMGGAVVISLIGRKRHW